MSRCIRGANPNDYEAGLKHVYTFKTVQVNILVSLTI